MKIKEMTLNVNESTLIPAGCKHRVENIGTEPLVKIEVQIESYLGEEDITRFAVLPYVLPTGTRLRTQ